MQSEDRLIMLGVTNALLQAEEDNRLIRDDANRCARRRDSEGLQCKDPHAELMFKREMDDAMERKKRAAEGGEEVDTNNDSGKAERKEDETFKVADPFESKPYECSDYAVSEYAADSYEYKSVYDK